MIDNLLYSKVYSSNSRYFKSVNGTIESLKLLMVYKECKTGWNKDIIPKHGHEMYEVLKKEIPLKEEL